MEGWLHLIRFNRFGLQYSRKRYFILHGNSLRSFKTAPTTDREEPVRSASIDSCIRVTDNGRESLHRKVLFIFTLYNNFNHNDQLKLGASSPEEAARWIRSIKDASSKECLNPAKNFLTCSKRKLQPFRLSGSKQDDHNKSVGWNCRLSMRMDTMTPDVVAPSPWKIFGCQNGLRLFREAECSDSFWRHWEGHPAIMAVGVIDGTSEAIFRTLMSLGSSRSEWDFCFYRGSVIEHFDGHTDIVHKQLYSDWLPWGMKRRDLLVQRYWRREDDGTYVILYHSVLHKKCPPQRGYVRACIKSGGYIVTPINHGQQSVVKHMLAIDWMFWKPYVRASSARSITICMLERVAGLRELFNAKAGSNSFKFLTKELMKGIDFPQSECEDIKAEVKIAEPNKKIEDDSSSHDDLVKLSPRPASLTELNDAPDEFYDVPEPSDNDILEEEWHSNLSAESQSLPKSHPKWSTAAVFAKKFHELAVQKKGYVDLQGMDKEGIDSCCYGTTLPKDPSCAAACSWSAADPSTFLIRGSNYLQDHKKVKARSTLMQMVGADWLKSSKREDDLGGRDGSFVQKYALRGGSEFFLIVNMQIPGTMKHNIVLYYMTKTRLEENPLLERFVNGDDAYRNSKFKLIPYISKGSWIVKQSIGNKACMLGQALEVNYFRGKNYLELGIDVGSSTVARGVVNLVRGYLTKLVIEMAFLIQADSEEELPEVLLGTCRLNHLDSSKAVIRK